MLLLLLTITINVLAMEQKVVYEYTLSGSELPCLSSARCPKLVNCYRHLESTEISCPSQRLQDGSVIHPRLNCSEVNCQLQWDLTLSAIEVVGITVFSILICYGFLLLIWCPPRHAFRGSKGTEHPEQKEHQMRSPDAPFLVLATMIIGNDDAIQMLVAEKIVSHLERAVSQNDHSQIRVEDVITYLKNNRAWLKKYYSDTTMKSIRIIGACGAFADAALRRAIQAGGDGTQDGSESQSKGVFGLLALLQEFK
jgi:hypothetical protein